MNSVGLYVCLMYVCDSRMKSSKSLHWVEMFLIAPAAGDTIFRLKVKVTKIKYQYQIYQKRCLVPCLHRPDWQGVTKVTKRRKYMNRQYKLKLVKISILSSCQLELVEVQLKVLSL